MLQAILFQVLPTSCAELFEAGLQSLPVSQSENLYEALGTD